MYTSIIGIPASRHCLLIGATFELLSAIFLRYQSPKPLTNPEKYHLMNRSNNDHELTRGSIDGSQSTDTDDEKAEKGPLEKDFLPSGFQPKEWDVICHNGKEPKSHGEKNAFQMFR